MLNFTGTLKAYLAKEPVDLRKSFSGLYALTMNVLKSDPCSGAVFVFTNKSHNRIKLLYWDGTGLWVMTKRLEQGRFSWPKATDTKDPRLTLRPEALCLLLDGVDLRGAELKPWYQR